MRHHPPAHFNMADYDTTDLHIGWGDRESDIKPYTSTPRMIQMRPPKVYRAKIDDVPASVTDAEVARVQALVDRLWTETPTVGPACESYRQILQGIHDFYLPKPTPEKTICRSRMEMRNPNGNGSTRHAIFDIPSRNPDNFWANVTDIPCPRASCRGTLRWAEAGYVPGYRICDKCKRHFLAEGDAAHPSVLLLKP